MEGRIRARTGRIGGSAGFILLACLLIQPSAGQERQARTAWAPIELSGAVRVELERQRREWFYGPRGPNYGAARLEALKQLDRMLAAEAAAGKAIAPSATQWTLIGPRPNTYPSLRDFPGYTTSGRVTALTVNPRNANVVYLGADNGGVWKTSDGGVTWTPLTDTQPSLAISSLALDPSNPDVVYAGTDEGGILKSSDGGAAWTNLATGFVLVHIASLAVHPKNGQILLAAVDGGISRSANGGTTWTGVLGTRASTGNSVLFDPTNENVAYAALANPNDPANGIYKSTDAGQTWNKIGGASLPSTNISTVRLAISPSSSNTLYASVAAQDGTLNGFFVSSDGGLNWLKRATTTDYCDGSCFFSRHVLGVHPTNPNIIYAGGLDLYVSPDGGASWTDISGGGSNGVHIHVDQQAVAFAAGGTKLYVGNDGGVYSTSDVGSTSPNWTSLNSTLAITQFYPGLSIHPSDPNIGFGGTQDTGTQKYSGSLAWTWIGECGDGGWTAIDPSNPSTVYKNCITGGPVWKSTSGGDAGTWTRAQNGISASDLFFFAAPLVIDPSNPQTVYLGARRLYQTTNGAASWTVVSPDLGGVRATAVAPSDSNTVYISAFRRLMVTKNAGAGAGATWNDIGAGLPDFGTQIAVDPTNALVAYVTFADRSSPAKTVFKTTNGGTSWTNISGNLSSIPVNDIVIDPDIPNTLYVGTDIGVFRSTDGGATWSTLVTGLPRTIVTGLRLHRPSRILRASTYGRSMWDLAVPLTATNPKPALASLSPTSATAGGAAFTLTVNGSGFLSSSVAQWKGSNRTTTFVSDSKLTAAITAADIATAGTAQVTVVNPAPGGGTSSALTFTINTAGAPNPVPALNSISPASATAGGAAFTLTVNGSGFLSSSVVQWNGSNRTTTFVSSTQLTAAITAADIAAAGTARVTVVNPSPGGGASNTLNFTIAPASTPGGKGGIITTVAGSSAGAQPVISGKATEAPLGRITGVAVAANGNVFLSDGENNLVLSVSSAGDIAVVAGTGSQGFEGDGGPATKAALNYPGGLATDASGNLYIADTFNHRIRKVSAAGTITTVAGNGEDGFSGDDSPATQASLSSPAAVAVDASGNLYIADSGNDRIRKVGTDGKISTFAGGGEPEDEVGDGGPATSARLSSPGGVSVDTLGNVFIADTSHHRIRKVATDGKISTVAGNGMEGFIDDPSKVPLATDISLSSPAGVTVSGGELFIADTGNNLIRRVSSAGFQVSYYGTRDADFGGDGGSADGASFNGPLALATDGRSLYIADTNNQRVRKFSITLGASRTISTIAGSGRSQSESGGGAATVTTLDHPRDVALDSKGNLYIADFGHNLVRKVGPDGALTTVAGNGEGCCSFQEGGPATSAALQTNGIAVDKADNLYIAAGEQLFKVTPAGNITSLPVAKGSARAVAVDAAGNVYFSAFDADGNGFVKKIAPGGTTATTVAGGGQDLGDGGPGTNARVFPFALALDTGGNLYIADIGFSRIRKLTPAGVISTVAGNGRQDPGAITDGAPATSMSLFEPAGLALDGSGNLYISDTGRTAVFRVGADGKIFRFAGADGRSGFSGDGGPATSATLNHPFGLALDAGGNLYIADTDNDVVRKVTFGALANPDVPVGTPKIAVSPSALSFQTLQGSNSSFQNLSITNEGGGTLSWSVSVSTPGGNWGLVINPAASGTAPSLLSVRVGSAQLAPGTYNGTITISAPGASNSPQTVAVKLIVSTTPVPPPSGTPTVTAPAITNGASFRSGVTPGAILTIFGAGLTKGVSGIVVADKLPLPTELRGTSVTIGGNPAPLFAIANVSGAEQINLQVPWEMASVAIADVVVNNNGVKGDPVPMAILQIQPGVFTLDGTTGVILHADNRLVSAGAPAKKGEVVIIYATGLGPVDPLPRTGEAAPSSPLSLTTNKPVVTVGNATAAVQFSGLAPGFVGLYQLNVTIPANATSGVQSLVIEIGGVRSKPVTMAIQ